MFRAWLAVGVVVACGCGPSKLAFSSGPVSVDVDACSSAITVQLVDGAGKPVKATATTVVALAVDTAVVELHGDSACGSALSQVTVSSGAESATFFAKGLAQGSGVLTATADKLTSATEAVTVTVAPYSIDDICRDLPSAVCAYAVRCGATQTEADCIDLVTKRVHLFDECGRDERAGVKDGRLTADPLRARRCVSSLRSTTACSRDDAVLANPDCAAAFVGAVAANQSCYIDDECGDAAYCSATSTGCPGQCLARQAASTTATRDRQCNAGLYVYNGYCVAPVSASGACGAILPSLTRQRCAKGSYCDAANVCSPLRTVGLTCAADTDCDGVLLCSNGTCSAAGAPSDTCNIGILGQPNIPCKSDLYCDVTALGTPGVCKVLESTGSPCLLTSQCKAGMYCDGATIGGTLTKGTCLIGKPATAACTSSEQCAYALYCDVTGHCVDRKILGASCLGALAGECSGSSAQCGAGLCCQALMCRPVTCHDPTP